MRTLRSVIGALAALLWPLAAGAQGLILFPAENYGQATKMFNESALSEAQLEVLMGRSAVYEAMADFDESNPYRRLGRSIALLDLLIEDTNRLRHNTNCTATRIASDLIISNYHCVPGKGFRTLAAQARFGFLDPLTARGQAFEVDINPVEASEPLDYVILKLRQIPDAAVYPPAPLRRHSVRDGESLILIHHPMGQPQRLTRFRCQAGRPAISEGRLVHHCDTQGGSSGAAVLTLDGFAFAGLHFAGVPDPNRPFNLAKPAADLFRASATLRALESAAAPAAPAAAVAVSSASPEPASRRAGDVFRDRFTSGSGEGPEMVVLPSGSFTMGSPASEAGRDADEGPQRSVRIGYALAVGKYEVTWAEWEACVADGECGGHRPSDQGWGKGTRPVINVSWDDAQSYVQWLSRKTGQRYRLLSEAEWEYAARAGTTTPFHTGATISTGQANYDGNYTYGSGVKGEYRQRTTPVGSFPANAFGLHDMHGNVWEWTQDCWNGSYTGGPTDGSAWTTGDCTRRVRRGGSWFSSPLFLRSAGRSWYITSNRISNTGFRVARTL